MVLASVVDRTQVQWLIEQQAQVLDVLPPTTFRKSHLPTARNLPLKSFTAEALQVLDKHAPVVVYCHDST